MLPTTDDDSLAHLLLLTGQGDHQAFSDFYSRTSRRVFGLARRVVIDHHLSEDVTQEVFALVWRDARKYDASIGSPLAWLMTITHHRAVDKVRAMQSSQNREERWAGSNGTPAYDEVLQAICDRSDARRAVTALVSLSALQRESIALAYIGCLTYSEVANKLSIPLPTVKSRVRDGLRKLRAQLEPVDQADAVLH